MHQRFKIFLILIVFGVGQNAVAQGLSIVYKVDYRPKLGGAMKQDFHVLEVCGEKSRYYSARMMMLDSLQKSPAKMGYEDQMKLLKSLDFNYILNKDRKSSTVSFTVFTSQPFSYTEKENIQWKLQEGSKTIGGYPCRKATAEFAGRQYTAYYAPDIPVADGPYKFQGLPGLILEISSLDGDYSLAMASVKKTDTCKNEVVLGHTFKSRKEYQDFFTRYLEDPSADLRLKDNSNGNLDYEIRVNGKPISKEENYKRLNNFVWEFVKEHDNPIEKNDLWIR